MSNPSEDNRILQELVKGGPGPAPYRLPSVAELHWKNTPLTWTIAPSDTDLPDGSVGVAYRYTNSPQLTAGKKILGVIDTGVYVYPHSSSNTLFTVGNSVYTKNQITLSKFPIDDLEEFPHNLIQDYGDVTELHTTLQDPTTYTFLVNRHASTEEIVFPPAFSDLGIFLNYVTSDDMQEYFLVEIDTAQGKITTTPQDWFNTETYDSGPQWPMYAVRDLQNQKIYGEGMRIGVFELAPDKRHIARWLGNN